MCSVFTLVFFFSIFLCLSFRGSGREKFHFIFYCVCCLLLWFSVFFPFKKAEDLYIEWRISWIKSIKSPVSLLSWLYGWQSWRMQLLKIVVIGPLNNWLDRRLNMKIFFFENIEKCGFFFVGAKYDMLCQKRWLNFTAKLMTETQFIAKF